MKKAKTIVISAFLLIFLMLNLKDMRKIQDLTGKVYGKLTVVGINPIKKYPKSGTNWMCHCDCGSVVVAGTGHLNSGRITQCVNCKYKYQIKHGLCFTKEYRTWQRIKVRCYNQKTHYYKHYGERGIVVCDRWLNSFENFLEDMGLSPGPEYSIDRIDTDGDYCPENCKWSTNEDQCNNKTNNIHLTYNGETLTKAQWCRKLGMAESTLNNRLLRGATVEEALTKPVRS